MRSRDAIVEPPHRWLNNDRNSANVGGKRPECPVEEGPTVGGFRAQCGCGEECAEHHCAYQQREEAMRSVRGRSWSDKRWNHESDEQGKGGVQVLPIGSTSPVRMVATMQATAMTRLRLGNTNAAAAPRIQTM